MKPDRQRQSEYKFRLQGKGLARLHCWVSEDTRTALRDIAAEHGQSIGNVIDLGMLLARQHLSAAPKARKVVITRPAPEATSGPTLSPEPSGDADLAPSAEIAPAGRQEPSAHNPSVDELILRAAYRVET